MADISAARLGADWGEVCATTPTSNALRCLEILVSDRQRLGGELPPARVDSLVEKRGLSASERSWIYAELGKSSDEPSDVADGAEIAEEDPAEELEESESSATTHADPIDYLRRATTEFPLLNAEEERVLGRLVLNGLALQQAVDAKEIDESSEMLAAINRGRAAHTKLVLSNLRLVMSIAYEYRRRTSIEVADLMQDGIIGLMRAVEGFDPQAGFRFSTYASHWIKQSISRAIDNTSRTIRIPVHMLTTIRKLRKALRRLEAETPRKPTLGKLADELGWDIETTEEVFALSAMTVISTDDEGDEENPSRPIPLIDQSPSPQEILESKELGSILEDLIAELPERQGEVIRRRFGFNSEGGQEETLEEIGIDFGVTRERIRQIEAKALERLRHPLRAHRLASYRTEQ